jgi:hypothetical protein
MIESAKHLFHQTSRARRPAPAITASLAANATREPRNVGAGLRSSDVVPSRTVVACCSVSKCAGRCDDIVVANTKAAVERGRRFQWHVAILAAVSLVTEALTGVVASPVDAG